MTEEERAERADAIVYSCDSRAELASYIVRLEAERDDLRELVRYMWQVIVHARDGVSYDKERELCERKRRLGVGVNG